MLVERSELSEVAMCLFEVVGQDLLVFATSRAFRIHAIGPDHEPLMQLRPGPLQQVLIGGIPDEDVLEPVAVLVERCGSGRADELLAGNGQ